MTENLSAWKILADVESAIEGGPPTITSRLIAETMEEAAMIAGCCMRYGATQITITSEDRAIRDGRRSVGLSGQVEIDGQPGWRRVEQAKETGAQP